MNVVGTQWGWYAGVEPTPEPEQEAAPCPDYDWVVPQLEEVREVPTKEPKWEPWMEIE